MNVDHPFDRHQDQCEDGKSDLDPFSASCVGRHWSHSPLRRRSGAQRPYSPYRIEVDHRAGNRDDLHGYTDRLAMNGGEQIHSGRRSGQRADSNEKSKTTERHEGCACALEQDKKQACESNDPRTAFHVVPRTSIDWRVLFEQGVLPQQCLFFWASFWVVVRK